MTTNAETLGAWIAQLSPRELYDEAALFRRTLLAVYGEDGITWDTLTDDHLAAALLNWLQTPRPDFSDFPALPPQEASETATDVRLYLEQFRTAENRPSTLSVDEFTGALRVVRRVLRGETGEAAPERANGPALRTDFNLSPKK